MKPQGEKYNLLLVDDEIMVIRAISRLLDRNVYNVFTTTNPQEVPELLLGTPIDIIISDHRMPEMTGLELLSKAALLQPAIKRILISGNLDVDDACTAVLEGQIDCYIRKPWDNAALVETINKAVGQFE